MKLFKEGMFFLLAITFASQFVSAQALPAPGEFIRTAIQAIQDIFIPIFTALFDTGKGPTTEFLFTKILLSILLFVIIDSVVKRIHVFKNQKGVALVISLIISIFAVRFISEEGLIAGILLPYGALGVALTTILPFLLFFFFIHDSQLGPFGRKITWIFFGIVFFFLWMSRYNELSITSNYIYVATLIGTIIVMAGDKSVHAYFRSIERQRADAGHIKDRINELRHRRDLALMAGDARRADEIDGEIRGLERRL